MTNGYSEVRSYLVRVVNYVDLGELANETKVISGPAIEALD
jgi:hypothetical protein